MVQINHLNESNAYQNGAARVANEAVFFNAALSRNTGGLTGAGGKAFLVADKVLQQIGNAYDAATGVFTAPYKGIYSFTCNLLLGPVTSSMTSALSSIFVGGDFDPVNYVSNVNGLVRDNLERVSFQMTEILMLDVKQTASCVAIIFSGANNSAMIAGMVDGTENPYSRFTGYMLQNLS